MYLRKPAHAVQWAVDEARRCAIKLRQLVLEPFGDSGGLCGPVRCAALSAAFCAALEHSHQLHLKPAFMAEIWEHLEGRV